MTRNETANNSVVVTGASTGIGLACAVRMAQLGFKVFAGVRRIEDGEALTRYSERIVPVLMDVTDEESIKSASAQVRTLLEKDGASGLTALVNNAGIVVSGPLEFLPIDDLRRQLEVNVIGQVAVTQAFMPLLRQAEQGTARIVNMSSYAGFMAFPFIAPYSASKFALEALSDGMRVELRRWKIFVSVIEPGNIRTPIWNKSQKDAEIRAERLPPEALELYGAALEKVRAHSQRSCETAIPVERVADAVAHAITSKRPKTRYKVGRHAQARGLFPLVPDGLKDWIFTKVLGLPES